MKLDLDLLSQELRSVGLSGNCACDGRVDFGDGSGSSWRPGDPIKTAEHKLAAQVLAAHDPTRNAWLYARRQAYSAAFSITDEIEALREALNERPEKIVAQQVVIDSIKKQYPKPVDK